MRLLSWAFLSDSVLLSKFSSNNSYAISENRLGKTQKEPSFPGLCPKTIHGCDWSDAPCMASNRTKACFMASITMQILNVQNILYRGCPNGHFFYAKNQKWKIIAFIICNITNS